MSQEAAIDTRRRGQVLNGTVVGDKNDKTVTVAVQTRIMHPLYKRYVKKTARFAAHDETNRCAVGDEVTIVSCRPMSAKKRWRVRDVVKAPGSAQ